MPAMLLTTLPMITGVGVGSGEPNTSLPPKIDVLDGNALDVTPFPPPKTSPSAPVADGFNIESEIDVDVLEASLVAVDEDQDMREVREDLAEALLRIVELEKLFRDELLAPEITR